MPGLMDFWNRRNWFGDDEQAQGPTPLFPPSVTTDKQSLFPVASDKPPISPSPTGPSGSGWGAVSGWLNAPAYGDEKGADPQGLMAYKPQSRLDVFGKMLLGAGQGVMAQRGPYANPLGGGMLGAGHGLEQAREQDQQGRQAAFEAQAKQAQVALERVKMLNEAARAKHAGDYTLGKTRFSEDNTPLATAPEEPMSEAEKQRLDFERQRLGQTDAAQAETARYHGIEAEQRNRQLGLTAEQNAATRAQAAATAAAGKTADERAHNKALGYSQKMAAGKELTPTELADYRDTWKTLAEPKVTLDPATGLQTTVNPDLSHLTPPPGETLPTPGPQIQPTLPPREQMTKAAAAHIGAETTRGTLDRLGSLLESATPGELLRGDKAASINTEAIALQSALGELQNSGVLQPSDIERYNTALGSLTGAGAAAGAAVGYQPNKAALKELRTMVDAKTRAAMPRALNPEDAKRMPKGVPFLMPSGTVGMN